MRRSFNVVPHAYDIDHQARVRLMGHPPRVAWLTGLPGSGKSTIADAVVRRLHAQGVHCYVLDGDNVRTGLNKDLGFTPEDRAENVRRVAEVARLMYDAGLVVLVALVSPYRSDRETAKALFDPGSFLEVYIDTPVEVCAERDPKGLYAKAAAGSLPNMTGVGQTYELPSNPDLTLTGVGDLEASAQQLAEAILGR
jgi:bifunctional enzyme CysN/CysC